MNIDLHKKRCDMVFAVLLLTSCVWMLVNGARSYKTFIDEYWTHLSVSSSDIRDLYPRPLVSKIETDSTIRTPAEPMEVRVILEEAMD